MCRRVAAFAGLFAIFVRRGRLGMGARTVRLILIRIVPCGAAIDGTADHGVFGLIVRICLGIMPDGRPRWWYAASRV